MSNLELLSKISLSKNIRKKVTSVLDELSNTPVLVSFYYVKPDEEGVGVVGYVSYYDVTNEYNDEKIDKVESLSRFFHYSIEDNLLSISHKTKAGEVLENARMDEEYQEKFIFDYDEIDYIEYKDKEGNKKFKPTNKKGKKK